MSHLRRDLFPVDPFCEDPTLTSVGLPRLPLHRRILTKGVTEIRRVIRRFGQLGNGIGERKKCTAPDR